MVEFVDDVSGENEMYKESRSNFKGGIIDNYRCRQESLKNKRVDLNTFYKVFENFNGTFNYYAERGIFGGNNLFGLKATYNPSKEAAEDTLCLSLSSGRFNDSELEKIFTTSEMVGTYSDDEMLGFFDSFYSMNNIEVLKSFGATLPICANDGKFPLGYKKYADFVVFCKVLEPLLSGKHSEIDIVTYSVNNEDAFISLGETVISLNGGGDGDWDLSDCEITIEKEGKEASVQFTPTLKRGAIEDLDTGETPFYIGEFGTPREEEIALDRDELINYLDEHPDVPEYTVFQKVQVSDDIEVENVKYLGDPELIAELQAAMQEQFESQRASSLGKTADEVAANMGAKKIKEFMSEEDIPYTALLPVVRRLFGGNGPLTEEQEKAMNALNNAIRTRGRTEAVQDAEETLIEDFNEENTRREDLPDNVIY